MRDLPVASARELEEFAGELETISGLALFGQEWKVAAFTEESRPFLFELDWITRDVWLAVEN